MASSSSATNTYMLPTFSADSVYTSEHWVEMAPTSSTNTVGDTVENIYSTASDKCVNATSSKDYTADNCVEMASASSDAISDVYTTNANINSVEMPLTSFPSNAYISDHCAEIASTSSGDVYAPDTAYNCVEAPSTSSAGKKPDGHGGYCAVCGAKAKSVHYGVLACEGCKSFFSRALIKHSTYTCPTNNACLITKETRNRCMYCRWCQCLRAGMSKDNRPGLEQQNMLEKQQLLLSKALRSQLQLTHPANHEDVFTRMLLLMPYVREINCHHNSLIVNLSKTELSKVFPPLHREVFGSDD